MDQQHLILSDLHAIAPGVLEVVFGPDGAFKGAPTFSGPVIARDRVWSVAAFNTTDGHLWGVLLNSADGTWPPDYESMVLAWCGLDLRVPSVAARLLSLLCRAISPKLHLNSWQTAADLATRMSRGEWNDDYAARTAELVRWYAPQIVALGV